MASAVNGIYFVNTVPGRQRRLTCIAVDDPFCVRRTFRGTVSLPINAIALLGVINLDGMAYSLKPFPSETNEKPLQLSSGFSVTHRQVCKYPARQSSSRVLLQ
jgi:hypothetical protein